MKKAPAKKQAVFNVTARELPRFVAGFKKARAQYRREGIEVVVRLQ